MRLLLDTNRYSDLVLREPSVVDRFSKASEVWLSMISVGELQAGFIGGRRRKANQDQLRDILAVRGVGLLLPSEETAEVYGKTLAALKKKGAMIPTNDIWIAAQALQHNLTLDTRDEHFKKVRGLKLV